MNALIFSACGCSTEREEKNRKRFPENDHVFQLGGIGVLNSAIAGMVLKSWNERKRTTMQSQPVVQMQLGEIAGLRTVGLPSVAAAWERQRTAGRVHYCHHRVVRTAERGVKPLTPKAGASKLFANVDSDLKIDKPQIAVEVDRDKAAQLGLTMLRDRECAGLDAGGVYVNYFSLAGRSYKVIPQVMQHERLNADQIKNYYITTPNGASIPASTIIRLTKNVVPESLNRFQ